MTAFALHPQLAADTSEIARWPLSLVLLMNDGRFPWLILVPQRANLREIHDLPAAERGVLIEEIARAGRLMQSAFRADKINTAALGNQVPQLHVHVIARFVGDAAWPNPIWSHAPRRPMSAAERSARLAALRPGLEGSELRA
jgi:diadenosine tetraphosphate (Ap4A) HIT family hydrolase